MILASTAAVLDACSKPRPPGVETPDKPRPTKEKALESEVQVLVDDFRLQPLLGEAIWYYNRLGGDRGVLNEGDVVWGRGECEVSVASGQTWSGIWESLSHPAHEGLTVDFQSLLPSPIGSAHQSTMKSLEVRILRSTPNRTLKVELKDGSELAWQGQTILEGGHQILKFDLPPSIRQVGTLVCVLDDAHPGDTVTFERLVFTATTQIADTPMRAFVWSYGMLLSNFSLSTGLVQDRASNASGEFDALQATGMLAAATAMAEQLGVVSRRDAIKIVSRIGQALLVEAPRYRGLIPHFARTGTSGEMEIVSQTEWSSIDSVISAMALLAAQGSLGLDTSGSEELLGRIDWQDLEQSDGLSMGYTDSGELIPWTYNCFGGEQWLVALAHAAVTGQVAPVRYPSPPNWNGSGFIEAIAWMLLPPPSHPDYWENNWSTYRPAAADKQILYYPPESCLSQLGLFGLSASETPDPSTVPPNKVYQAFGVGGRTPANDGTVLLGAPVAVPHYSAMIASLRPQESVKMWDWLIEHGLFSPMTNVESLMFPAGSSCDLDSVVYNSLLGSWNLSLQVLGWAHYLVKLQGQEPALYTATMANPLLRRGYGLLAPNEPAPIPALTPALGATRPSAAWSVTRECEVPDESTVGQTMERPSASAGQVHGQFGTKPAWPAQPGHVTYTRITIPETEHLYLRLRYSKHSLPSVPIRIYVDDESKARASYHPIDQGSWETFAWSEPILLGMIATGMHSIKFATDGQIYGVADLDMFILADEPPASRLNSNSPSPAR